MAEAPQLYLGLISGTSADGIDAALVQFNPGEHPTKCQLLGTHKHNYPDTIRQEVIQLCTPTSNEIDRLGQLDIALGELFGQAALSLLEQLNIPAEKVRAIGSHGQTVRHRPSLTRPFTLQIADPNTIAQTTGITTVADFRRRDMAAGGQGAPLAPAFHQYLFSDASVSRCVLNIGGIANITILKQGSPVIGYDTGPANGLMDAWIYAIQRQDYDHNGDWAATGSIDEGLLKQLLCHSYFNIAPPKSTGREEFHFAWLEQILSQFSTTSAADVQATLCELTAITIAQEVRRFECREVYVCGGGAHNSHLLRRLNHHLPQVKIAATSALGLHPDWVEASCFAWLAKQSLEHQPGNLPSVTGAKYPVILGGIYY
ncbi:Anhydro-N-acetylmuramic acid kinase [Thalassocella blandensis]|nr:Anhydro-N-acetylmuramic acid kinase [Thalassocella blandensis]